jgi:cell division protein FtsI (penicillin-binding protein 3)
MATNTTVQTHKRQRSSSSSQRVTIPHWRIMALLGLAFLLILRMVLRLGELQVVQSADLADKARREINQQVTLHPSRGLITDRHGNVLAMDIERESLWVVPAQIPANRAPQLALTLAPLIGRDEREILTALTDSEKYWLPIARWLEPAVAERIEMLEEPGLRLIYEPRRIYPQNAFASQIIGATNFNGDGISGVESYYNTALKGITGTLTAEFDPVNNPIAIAPQERRPARDGVNLRLTIDPFIQHMVEDALKAAVEQHNADGGTILVIEPDTGAIRGMASWPPFDPNRYGDYPPEVYSRNPAVSDLYEPGSTFKIITVAAGMQTGAFTADTAINDPGVVNRFGDRFHNWNHGGNGVIDPGGVLYHSSNVGALQLNEMTGAEDFYRIVRDFGFGASTGIDLGGEEQGIVHGPSSPFFNDVLLLTNSYGQGISMTPLQLTRAVAAIANDGVLMRPYVVEEICDADECTLTEPTEVRQVVDPGVAWTVRRMLVHSANHYAPVVWSSRTGSWADQWLVPGYQVGAKTGTASIPLPGGGYDPSFTIGSVVGFAPADDARYAVLVKIDRPKDDIWGVGTAIPVFYKVVDELMDYARVQPNPGLVSPSQPW